MKRFTELLLKLACALCRRAVTLWEWMETSAADGRVSGTRIWAATEIFHCTEGCLILM